MYKLHREDLKKLKKTVVLSEELVKWIEEMIKKREFASLSHALEKALYRMREDYKKREG